MLKQNVPTKIPVKPKKKRKRRKTLEEKFEKIFESDGEDEKSVFLKLNKNK